MLLGSLDGGSAGASSVPTQDRVITEKMNTSIHSPSGTRTQDTSDRKRTAIFRLVVLGFFVVFTPDDGSRSSFRSVLQFQKKIDDVRHDRDTVDKRSLPQTTKITGK
jgi:hypothetical protein